MDHLTGTDEREKPAKKKQLNNKRKLEKRKDYCNDYKINNLRCKVPEKRRRKDETNLVHEEKLLKKIQAPQWVLDLWKPLDTSKIESICIKEDEIPYKDVRDVGYKMATEEEIEETYHRAMGIPRDYSQIPGMCLKKVLNGFGQQKLKLFKDVFKHPVKKIGEGSFGEIYKCVYRMHGQNIVNIFKVVPFEPDDEKDTKIGSQLVKKCRDIYVEGVVTKKLHNLSIPGLAFYSNNFVDFYGLHVVGDIYSKELIKAWHMYSQNTSSYNSPPSDYVDMVKHFVVFQLEDADASRDFINKFLTPDLNPVPQGQNKKKYPSKLDDKVKSPKGSTSSNLEKIKEQKKDINPLKLDVTQRLEASEIGQIQKTNDTAPSLDTTQRSTSIVSQ
uniref:Protein kinase domain-containing protein n=1 Tax=Parastrongyloides trichosuri TaxID=131310 RepID=A0A0N4ZFY7_PARTI